MLTPRFALLALLVFGCGFAGPAHSAEEPDHEPSQQDRPTSTWDVSSPPGARQSIPIDVRSGTWMSVDVSPDGQSLAFDLLGDIYLLPIAGGTARSLTSGLPWNKQPRFSPDGSQIAFTSDRAGGDNLWVMDADGANPRQVTREDFRLLNNPVWHPDGRFLAARKHFTTWRSLGTGEVWTYSVDGGDGVQLVERPSPQFQKELGEPAFSPDGRYLYFTQNITAGPIFEYAQDSNREVFQIRRQNLATGEIEPFITGPGGAVRPTPSPDGRYLAFVRRVRGNGTLDTALFLKDLRSGEERLLYDALERDMQETWSVHGVYPNMAWTPDSASIVFWAGGGIRRIDLASGTVGDIPFHVQDQRETVTPPRFAVEVAPDEVEARMARFATVSPDGRRAVFEAFGRLWVKDLTSGATRRLTRDQAPAFELFPAWSRDGRRLAFVRWTDAGLGHIHLVDGAGGRSQAVTRDPGHYRLPQFSPDGASLVFERGTGNALTSPLWIVAPGIYRMPAAGGTMVRIDEAGRDPHFGAAGDRIYFNRPAENDDNGRARELVSVDWNGADPRVHARARYATRMTVSPSGRWLAFRENFHVYVLPMPPGGAVDVSRETKAVPLRRVTEVGGEFLNWSTGDALTWTVGPALHAVDVARLPAVPADDPAARPPGNTAIADLAVRQPADRPSGTLALVGARIVTMDDDDRVIEQAVVVVRDNRIIAAGPLGDVEIPGDAQTIDVTGRTILPGLIDVHAHGVQGIGNLIPQQNWLALAHLAFGVTTVHDPANRASEIFAAAEYQRAGTILAPRLFSTGEILYGALSDGYVHIATLDDARAHVRRLKAQGAIAVKNYNQPRREQRQMVVAAAREAGLMVVAEGGSLYHMDMNLIADGNTGIEHNVPGERFYDDVLQFWPATGVGYTPTLVVTYGGIWGEDWFYQHDDVWRHPLLSRFVPPTVLQPRSVRRQMAPDSDYQAWRDSAANAKRLMERGVLVNIGAHGQREGLAAHWEIRGFVRGGMTPLQALKTATINPARYLGMDGDIGSIEAGKLADLLIVDGNPLDDIEVTDKVAYVVLNGRVYEGGTLAETVTGTRRLAPFYWM
jgi:imidazolonepropionase-like amidohydrolase/Tol biopolymer transport system component